MSFSVLLLHMPLNFFSGLIICTTERGLKSKLGKKDYKKAPSSYNDASVKMNLGMNLLKDISDLESSYKMEEVSKD